MRSSDEETLSFVKKLEQLLHDKKGVNNENITFKIEMILYI